MGRFLSGTAWARHGMARRARQGSTHIWRIITSASTAVKEPGRYQVPADVPRSTAHLSLGLCAPVALPVARSRTAASGEQGVRAAGAAWDVVEFASPPDAVRLRVEAQHGILQPFTVVEFSSFEGAQFPRMGV